MITPYNTLVVKFNSPIAVIDEVFNDVAYLGVNNLKEWIDRFSQGCERPLESPTGYECEHQECVAQ